MSGVRRRKGQGNGIGEERKGVNKEELEGGGTGKRQGNKTKGTGR